MEKTDLTEEQAKQRAGSKNEEVIEDDFYQLYNRND